MKPLVSSLLEQAIHSMTVSVLSENKACQFYQHLGAVEIDRIEIVVAGKRLMEVIYGWDDIRNIM